MNLVVFGGDMRMDGAVRAARRAGWTALHVRSESDMEGIKEKTDAVMLPWPAGFAEDRLIGGEMSREQTLSMLPPCRMALHGADVSADELRMAGKRLNPAGDEAFLTVNARLTAEGAICCAMQQQGKALLDATAMITGFGRIAQALTQRLTALGVFVIICARNEQQMRQAHAAGAHPMALERLAAAAAQADVVFNTVPARIMSEAILKAVDQDALVIDLASAPYGADAETARKLGVRYIRESGLPGRYAPENAGAALFDALQRGMTEADGKGGESDG
ncbi:MAG: NAD(P)-binding domain-containing protein [Clostridia bacterium]|nr:NAD(P)-binding domain-containing protein [Clostridia bacterium]